MRRRARPTMPRQAMTMPGRPAPTMGPGTAWKPSTLSGPSSDAKHGEGPQPADIETPAKKPELPDIAKMLLNCACSALFNTNWKTELPFPVSRARSAGENWIVPAVENVPSVGVLLLLPPEFGTASPCG